MDYDYINDLKVIKDVAGLSWNELAEGIGIHRATLFRWLDGTAVPSPANLDSIYSYAFIQNCRLNEMQVRLYNDMYAGSDTVVLFHGAKTEVASGISFANSRKKNDFGQGFYCGETFVQAEKCVAQFPDGSVYILAFDRNGLNCQSFSVSAEWILAVSYYRGYLDPYPEYRNHPKMQAIIEKTEAADYICAPVADNTMYEMIHDFAEEFTTDGLCCRCLAASDPGYQYIFRKGSALERLTMLHRCYLTEEEKTEFIRNGLTNQTYAAGNVRAARREYMREGQTIGQILS
ncbi:MAG: DUF3990 domain-containing protein [Clostridia bacterium]|nr:DUF3990 domain-containing protein [Clostridia bacterium]